MNKGPNTLADLARIAGVSVTTVSRSLAGNPVIAKSTRQRVVALAREHGFKINQSARNLRLKRTGAIGVILPLGHEQQQHLSDPFFMSLLGPLADALSENGYDLLLSRVIPSDEGWLDEMTDSGKVDGVIVIGQSNQTDVIEKVSARYRPIVVWGAAAPGMLQTTVGSDNIAGGRLAASHLLAQGRRRLAFFGASEVPEFAARLDGFRQAISEVADAKEPLLLPVHLTTEESYSAIAEFLSGHPPPDGIVAASDVIAMSALRALGERGLRIPHDVAVIGYDDVLIATHTNPPLTTIRQDVERGARSLVELLFQRMEGKEVSSVMMEPELVLRVSA
ncbi:LacI family DNA-binding transcriptional regulator [Qipengyuania qiaonensis]|uniref:LacI family DNA-binding transcriptional regulator n=1 Tax=Qipengyuania qiaonensis TaxID=2867240 RepID=UPI001FFD2599|nr:LacI family DNA-binding transcriptional regulator [Qipengyuania qiaonensis]